MVFLLFQSQRGMPKPCLGDKRCRALMYVVPIGYEPRGKVITFFMRSNCSKNSFLEPCGGVEIYGIVGREDCFHTITHGTGNETTSRFVT